MKILPIIKLLEIEMRNKKLDFVPKIGTFVLLWFMWDTKVVFVSTPKEFSKKILTRGTKNITQTLPKVLPEQKRSILQIVKQ